MNNIINVKKISQRKRLGKSESRRLRKENKIPAIIYGKGFPVIYIEIYHEIISKLQNNKNFYNKEQIFFLEEEKITAKLHDIQYHPFKLKIFHMDFLRI